MKILHFEFLGCPIAKQRPRIVLTGNKFRPFRVYISKKIKEQEETIQKQLLCQRPKITTAPIKIKFIFYFPKKKKDQKYHIQKPDLDNLIKLFLDAFKGIIYYDDRQIFSLEALKTYGEPPRTVVSIGVFDENGG